MSQEAETNGQSPHYRTISVPDEDYKWWNRNCGKGRQFRSVTEYLLTVGRIADPMPGPLTALKAALEEKNLVIETKAE